jgi:hypothetical protein
LPSPQPYNHRVSKIKIGLYTCLPRIFTIVLLVGSKVNNLCRNLIARVLILARPALRDCGVCAANSSHSVPQWRINLKLRQMDRDVHVRMRHAIRNRTITRSGPILNISGHGIGRNREMATKLCQQCKQAHPGRVCDHDKIGECAETIVFD